MNRTLTALIIMSFAFVTLCIAFFIDHTRLSDQLQEQTLRGDSLSVLMEEADAQFSMALEELLEITRDAPTKAVVMEGIFTMGTLFESTTPEQRKDMFPPNEVPWEWVLKILEESDESRPSNQPQP